MRFPIQCSLPIVCLALSACAVPDDSGEDVATSAEAIVNGTALPAEGSGFVMINRDCSGTLVSNDWVLTAKHCRVGVGAHMRMGSQERRVASVVEHRCLDIALAHLSEPMVMNGSRQGYRKPLRTAPLSVGETVGCAGYGVSHTDSDFGTLHVARLRVSGLFDHEVVLQRNNLGQIQTRGDSGGSCLDDAGQIAAVARSTRFSETTGAAVESYDVSSVAIAQWVIDRIEARKIALRAPNGSYFNAVNGGGGAVRATVGGVGPYEIFSRIDLGENKIALRASSGHYVVAEGGGGREVNANRTAIGPWEIFTEIDLGHGRFALQAQNGQYVVAEGGGGREVNANRGARGEFETFHRIDLTGDEIALQAQNGQYVVAEGGGGGGSVVNANRNAVGPWEKFKLVDLHGHVALRSSNGQYVVAEQSGGGAVKADRGAIGPWETFGLFGLGERKIALRAPNGQYVVAEGGGGREVKADRNAIGPWEEFTLVCQ